MYQAGLLQDHQFPRIVDALAGLPLYSPKIAMLKDREGEPLFESYRHGLDEEDDDVHSEG
jgi:hypothetical protein